jgi:hypothetical protein
LEVYAARVYFWSADGTNFKNCVVRWAEIAELKHLRSSGLGAQQCCAPTRA